MTELDKVFSRRQEDAGNALAELKELVTQGSKEERILREIDSLSSRLDRMQAEQERKDGALVVDTGGKLGEQLRRLENGIRNVHAKAAEAALKELTVDMSDVKELKDTVAKQFEAICSIKLPEVRVDAPQAQAPDLSPIMDALEQSRMENAGLKDSLSQMRAELADLKARKRSVKMKNPVYNQTGVIQEAEFIEELLQEH